MTDAEGLMREVIGARRAGRQITCRVQSGTPDDAAKQWKNRYGWQRWPSGSIVAPARPFERRLGTAVAHGPASSR